MLKRDAHYWARFVGGPDAVPYSTLKPGDRFRFPGCADWNVKLRGSKYRTAEGWWTTGRNTAVIPEKRGGP